MDDGNGKIAMRDFVIVFSVGLGFFFSGLGIALYMCLKRICPNKPIEETSPLLGPPANGSAAILPGYESINTQADAHQTVITVASSNTSPPSWVYWRWASTSHLDELNLNFLGLGQGNVCDIKTSHVASEGFFVILKLRDLATHKESAICQMMFPQGQHKQLY